MGHPFDTKRRFKRCMQIILILFVSFFVSVSCGIPSYFYMHEGSSGPSTSYYKFTSINNTNTYELEFAIDIVDTNTSVTHVDGPSLVYLYTIVPIDFTENEIESITKKFKSNFLINYIRNNTGKPITITSNKLDYMKIKYENKSYNMYKFKIYNSLNNEEINNQNPPEYGLKLNSDLNLGTPYNSSFAFKYLEDILDFKLVMDQTDANNYFVTSGSNINISDDIDLRMYNGNKFLKKPGESIDGYDNIDFNTNYKIVVYSALNVSKGSGFTNIFWSTLQEVGIIPSGGL